MSKWPRQNVQGEKYLGDSLGSGMSRSTDADVQPTPTDEQTSSTTAPPTEGIEKS